MQTELKVTVVRGHRETLPKSGIKRELPVSETLYWQKVELQQCRHATGSAHLSKQSSSCRRSWSFFGGEICRHKCYNISIGRTGYLKWTKPSQAPEAALHRACYFQSIFSCRRSHRDHQTKPAAGHRTVQVTAWQESKTPKPARTVFFVLVCVEADDFQGTILSVRWGRKSLHNLSVRVAWVSPGNDLGLLTHIFSIVKWSLLKCYNTRRS